MSETTDLVVIEKADALSVFKDKTRIEEIIQHIEKEARLFVPDLSTVTSRKAIGSMANKVARSKTYIDGVGKDVVAELKELPKQIDEQRRIVRERLDALKDEVRRPLTEWEAEQERIAAEKAAEEERQRIVAEELAAAEALKKQIESDHEIALLLNDKFDRDAAEAKAEAERQRVAREEEIKRQAIEQARIEAEQEAQQERDAAAKREADLKAAAEQAERKRIEAQERGEREAKEAKEKAEREKQQAIEAEQLKARQEADRIKREAEQKEATRLAEEKRIADEAAARAANEAHRKTIGTAVVNALIAHAGLTREDAIATLVALKGDLIPHTRITY
jgi:chromosome segregation ATPase